MTVMRMRRLAQSERALLGVMMTLERLKYGSDKTADRLAHETGHTLTTVRQALNRMVRWGYVSKCTLPGMGGPQGYSITDKGRDIYMEQL